MNIPAEAVTSLVGGVVTLAAMLLKHILDTRKSRADSPSPERLPLLPRLAVSVVLGLGVGLAAGMLIERRRLDSSPPPAPPEVRILSPAADALVPMEPMIRGVSARVRDGDSVWVVVYVPGVGRYYPQDRPADMQAGGGWNSLARVGIDADSGRTFDVLAVSASAPARSEFRRYLETSRRLRTWEGMDALPAGATEFHRVSVRRQR